MQSIRGPLAGLMCFSLLIPSEAAVAQSEAAAGEYDSAATGAHGAARTIDHPAQMQGDERILHALNRFTFGVRPGDVDAIRGLGLDRWFDEQLHPAKIDLANLNARLAAYPAMQWRSEELLLRLPSKAMIRQSIDGKVPVPERGVLHSVYENAMYRMAENKQKKRNKAQATAAVNDGSIAPAKNAEANGALSLMDSLDNDGTMDETAIMATMAAKSGDVKTDRDLVEEVFALEPQQRIARLVAMQPANAEVFFKSLRGPQRAALVAGMPPELRETVGALENPERTVVEELIAQRLTRDIYSPAQLEEVMADFWLNHFNVYLRKNEATPYYLVGYERDAIRPHAMGKFEDLLEAVAHSPAMLVYLDNASSTGPDSPAAERAKANGGRNPNAKNNRGGLNENYARELMELHTLGVNGGYTQADVIQVAHILTGWTVERPQRGGEFRFKPNRHEPGTKKVMGKKFKENGEREGEELLHFLSTRPATAHFISRKLAVRFVSDDPPSSLVDRMAASYMRSGGDIAAVLKTMFRAPEFWSADVYRAKVKTPLEYVVSAVRASDAVITNLRPLANALREMGMPLYGAIPPTGYKWDASEWVSTGALVNRMNFGLTLAGNRLPGISTLWASPAAVTTPQEEETRLEGILTAGRVSESTRAAVLRQYEAQSSGMAKAQSVQVTANGRGQNRGMTTQEKQDQLLAGLLLGSPEFQRR
jgi:uncharacterized protein (DUF1800 family)